MATSEYRFVFTHLGEMVQVTDEISMSRALHLVPGVSRASDPLLFLIRNVGWGIMVHNSMTSITLRFNESTVTKTALKRMYDALKVRSSIHSKLQVKLSTNALSSSTQPELTGPEALNYLRAILDEVALVSINQNPIRQVPKPVDSNKATIKVCTALSSSDRPTDDIFHIVREAGLDHGEITSYFADPDSGRFVFTHIGSNVRNRAELTEKVVATEFLGRPIERAMSPQSAINLEWSLRMAQKNLRPIYEQCEMELIGRSFEYNRLTLPVVAADDPNSISNIITVVTDVRAL